MSKSLDPKGVFHTGSARGSARILSQAWAEPLVWTPCCSDQKFQAYTQNLSWTVFTLEAQVKLSSGSAQKFLSRAPSRASVKCPNVSHISKYWVPRSKISQVMSWKLCQLDSNLNVFVFGSILPIQIWIDHVLHGILMGFKTELVIVKHVKSIRIRISISANICTSLI